MPIYHHTEPPGSRPCNFSDRPDPRPIFYTKIAIGGPLYIGPILRNPDYQEFFIPFSKTYVLYKLILDFMDINPPFPPDDTSFWFRYPRHGTSWVSCHPTILILMVSFLPLFVTFFSRHLQFWLLIFHLYFCTYH